MDLGKALRAKIDNKPINLVGEKLATAFLHKLYETLAQDIEVLSKDSELYERGFSRMSLESGSFEAAKKSNSASSNEAPPYIFIHLKEKPGFLVELAEGATFRLLRAKKVVPLLADVSGAPVRPTLIVGQGGSLEEFEVLDLDTVRTLNARRTLSIEQTSEMLLLLAFDGLAISS